ncbi:MAG TPA: DUF2254 domain-containing protein [Chloroflexia bacterium]|nr:DUF2254 domain-containing protein [Chloroflexia bacterium]
MRAKFIDLMDTLRTSFWFLPLIMALGSIGLYYITINYDKESISRGHSFAWLYTGGPGDASVLLSDLAGASITVAGVTFSLMIAALTMASSQFGPRLIRNFMRDLLNQVALGLFSATFIYCLLVLRTVQGEADTPFVPYLSISICILLALASLVLLILFIHHVSLSIQVAYIIANVSHELETSIKRLYPQIRGKNVSFASELEAVSLPPDFEDSARSVNARRGGYIQVIDLSELLNIAINLDLVIRLDCKPGDFMVAGRPLLKVWPGHRLDTKLAKRLASAFILGRQRTTMQDVESDINQLVEVAIRALSPAINDPFSAMMCIDRLGEALIHLANRPFPSPYIFDKSGKLRVITQTETFEQYVSAAFNQIRQYGAVSVSVTIRLLDMIGLVASCCCTANQRESLRRQVVMIKRASQKFIFEEWDRDSIEEHYQKTLKNLSI